MGPQKLLIQSLDSVLCQVGMTASLLLLIWPQAAQVPGSPPSHYASATVHVAFSRPFCVVSCLLPIRVFLPIDTVCTLGLVSHCCRPWCWWVLWESGRGRALERGGLRAWTPAHNSSTRGECMGARRSHCLYILSSKPPYNAGHFCGIPPKMCNLNLIMRK